jgi:hypothetical protein
MPLTRQNVRTFVDRVNEINASKQFSIEITLAVNSPVAQVVLDQVNANLGTAYTMADIQQAAADVITGAL